MPNFSLPYKRVKVARRLQKAGGCAMQSAAILRQACRDPAQGLPDFKNEIAVRGA
jgi:hypothetical protein